MFSQAIVLIVWTADIWASPRVSSAVNSDRLSDVKQICTYESHCRYGAMSATLLSQQARSKAADDYTRCQTLVDVEPTDRPRSGTYTAKPHTHARAALTSSGRLCKQCRAGLVWLTV